MRQQMATKEMIVIPDDDEESCAAVSKSPPPAAPTSTSSTDTAPSTEHTATGAPLYSVTTALPQHQSRYSQGSRNCIQ